MEPQEKRFLEITDLRWQLVEKSRQSWHYLSIAVLSAGAWILVTRVQNPVMGLALGPIPLLAGLAWVLALRSLRGMRQRLEALGEDTDPREFHPPVPVRHES